MAKKIVRLTESDMTRLVKKVTNEQTHSPKMNTYLFKGTIDYTEYVSVEIECETLEEAQKRIDDKKFDDDNIISRSKSKYEHINLTYTGIENGFELDDPRLIDFMFKKK